MKGMNTMVGSIMPRTQEPMRNYAMDDDTKNVSPTPQLESDSYKAAGKLEGKKVLITGGDSGIGAAVAIACAKEGADVAISYYDSDEDAEWVAQRIEEIGPTVWVFRGDIGDEIFCNKMIHDIVKGWESIDVLINNAGEQTPSETLMGITQEQLVRTFQTNIFGMFYLTKAAIPHMKPGSAIINTTSVTAYRGSKDLIDYASTKGAIVSFTRSLAVNEDILKRGIRVNGVAPGPIWTPLNPAGYGMESEKIKAFGKNTPLGRPGQPHELAAGYVYLACDDSQYVTGQILHVNGGESVGG